MALSALRLVLSACFLTTTATSFGNNNICPSNNNVPTINNNNNMITAAKLRSVKTVLPRPSSHWVGDGFRVYPIFSNKAFTEELSPWLMFDYAEPKQFPAKVGAPLGVGRHPHRGFQTITIAFQGEVEHHDSTGNSGIIKEGDVQWMHAGRGIIHQEYHSNEFTKNGGTIEMAQLWLNLPKKYKMTKPGYQAIVQDKIPTVNLPLGTEGNDVLATVRLIAGDLGDTAGAAETFSPVQLWDLNLPHAGAEIDLPIPSDHNCIVFVRRGSVEILSHDGKGKDQTTTLNPQDAAVMRFDGGDTLRVRAAKPDSSLLILGGEPFNEPIAAQGPFVMNTQEELRQAMSDYQMGKF